MCVFMRGPGTHTETRVYLLLLTLPQTHTFMTFNGRRANATRRMRNYADDVTRRPAIKVPS